MKNANYVLENKDSKNLRLFKIFASVIFSAAVIAMFVYVAVKGDLQKNALMLSCVSACFVLALIFVRLSSKKIFITLALALSAASDFFLVFAPKSQQNDIIFACLVLGVQFLFFLYTLALFKGFGAILANAAARVIVCLVLYFVLIHFFVLDTTATIALMYVCNSFVSLLWALFAFRRQWLVFFGLLLFFANNFCAWMTSGAAKIFGIGGNFLEVLTKYNLAFYFYIPALLLIALGAVWQGQEK